MARATQTQACRLEVRLLRRLPALAARLRGRTAGGRRRDRHRLFPRSHARRDAAVRTTCRWWKARSPRRTTPNACMHVRRQSRTLITIGACATAGGIQALRNFKDVREFTSIVYARPEYHRHAGDLDADQRACQRRLRAARLPDQQAAVARGADGLPERHASRTSPSHSVCMECKQRGTVCVLVRGHRRASARSPMPAAVRSAPPTTAAAMAASDRRRRRTPRR